ncbi:MAG: sigma-70 family RNA polymerase sigma factor [Myxococcaceae bacterium]|nr:sigma-70 family RNA polymerase sigma factor [Myxococcaceae bacterium]
MTSAVADADAEGLEHVRALYEEHGPRVASLLRRLTWASCDVEDLLQEVFMVAIQRASDLTGVRSPRAWLFGVAAKVAGRARSRRQLRTFFGLLDDEVPAHDARLEALQLVHRCLDVLSAKKREVLVLFELEGLTGPEIAEALGIPLKTVWTRLHHARRELEAEVARHG